MDELIATLEEVTGAPVSPSTPLISSGIIDSFGVILLLATIEERYGVIVEPLDVSVESMDTAERILELVRSRRVTT